MLPLFHPPAFRAGSWRGCSVAVGGSEALLVDRLDAERVVSAGRQAVPVQPVAGRPSHRPSPAGLGRRKGQGHSAQART